MPAAAAAGRRSPRSSAGYAGGRSETDRVRKLRIQGADWDDEGLIVAVGGVFH